MAHCVHRSRIAMARGLRVHARRAQVGWCLSGESRLREDETTNKVPDYLVDFARWLEDDPDTDTQPMRGPAVHPPSGIVPAGTAVAATTSTAVAATPLAFAPAEVPFLAPAATEQDAVRPRPSTLRANVTQSIAAALVALAALLFLFARGAKPRVVARPAARVAVTTHARAERSDTRGTMRSPMTRAAATHVDPVPRPEWHAPPVAPVALAAPLAKAPGRIIRTAPF